MTTKKYYPPIPGIKSGRGRPSLEEMERRRVYWESQGTVASTPTPAVVKSLPPVQPADSFVKHATAAPTVKKEEGDKVIEAIKTYIKGDVKEISINKEQYNEIKTILESLPPKKQGRPSREDVEAREKADRRIRSILTESVNLQLQAAATTESGEDEEVLPGKKQYDVFDRVRMINGIMPEGVRRPKGTVKRQDFGSKWILVEWDDGSQTWHSVDCLEWIAPKKTRKKKNK